MICAAPAFRWRFMRATANHISLLPAPLTGPVSGRATADLVLQRIAAAAIEALQAGVAELVDARDSKSRSARSVGSIPSTGTINHFAVIRPHSPRLRLSP